MKKIVLAFSLLAAITISAVTPAKAQTPIVRYDVINEIIELYRDGQYDIVKAKLTNQGFKVTKSETDYTLHGITHAGVFTVQFEEESYSALLRQSGDKQISEWDFNTEIKNGYVINEISNAFYSLYFPYYAKTLYGYYLNTYEGSPNYREQSMCDTDEICFAVMGDTYTAPSGFIDNINFHFSLGTSKTEFYNGTKTEYHKFDGSYRYVRREAPAPTKPIIRKKPTLARKKK